MTRRGVLLTVTVALAAAAAIGAFFAFARIEPKGRAGFAGDRVANLGYAVWLAASGRTLFVQRRGAPRNCSLITYCPASWHVAYPPRRSSQYVRVREVGGAFDLPLTWGEVRYALRTGRSATAPDWVKRDP